MPYARSRSIRHRNEHSVANEEPRRPPVSKFRTCCRKFIAFLVSNVGLCFLVIAYSVGGAFMFRAVEGPYQVKVVDKVIELRNYTIHHLWNITYNNNVLFYHNWSLGIETEIKAFQDEIMKLIKDGYEGIPKDGSNQEQWSFSGAFLFSLTVISTIGYGNISPRTDTGKLLTILYAIIGIPLMVLYLTNIGDILAKSFRYVYGSLRTLCRSSSKSDSSRRDKKNVHALAARTMRQHAALQRSISSITPSSMHLRVPLHPTNSLPSSPILALNRHNNPQTITSLQTGSTFMNERTLTEENAALNQRHNNRDVSVGSHSSRSVAEPAVVNFDIINERTKESTIVHVPITLCLVILASYICGGGALFSIWEGWEYLDGTYFCFVTLSTIGFGDLVPGAGSSGTEQKLVICSLYLLAGLALLVMCFNLMQEEVIHKLRNCGKRVGIFKDNEDEDDFEDDFDIP